MKTLLVFVGAACGLLFAAGTAHSQQTQTPAAAPTAAPAPQSAQLPAAATPKLSTQVKVVTLYATARDKKGKIIANLNKEDFVLDEDGRPQTITYFVRETDVPLTMGLLVDTSLSQRRLIDSERDASYTFLDHMLREDKDKAFLIHFDREVELLQDLTSSRPKLQAGLQQLQTPTLERASDDDNDGGERHHAGTLLYDAIYLAANELMKKQQGRKAIFVLTDGVDRGSKESLADAVEAAQRADTSIYSIYFADQEEHEHQGGGHGGGWGMGHGGYGGGPGYGGGWPGGGQGGPGGGGGGHRYPQEAHVDGKKVLTQLSNETGGRMIEVSKKLPIDQAYAQIEEELRNQYSLAYTPTPADTGAGYHKIHLAAKNSDINVYSRDGYYTGQ